MPKKTLENTDKRGHMVNGGYDEDYIAYYVDNPKAGRCEALRLAGYQGEYITQEASRIHKRCQDKIKQIFTDRIANLDGSAYQQLSKILGMDVTDVGFSNMLTAIRAGMDYAGRKPGDVLTVKTVKTVDDLDTAISDNLKQIAIEEGKDISQVLKDLQSPMQH